MTDQIPVKCLARLFPNGVTEFYENELKKTLEIVKYGRKEGDHLANDEVLGINSLAIAYVFFNKFKYWWYLGIKEAFLSEFTNEIFMVILEVRKREWLWDNIYREVEKVKDNVIREDEKKKAEFTKDIVGSVEKKREGDGINALGRILNNFDKSTFDFAKYYRRFYPLFNRHVPVPNFNEILAKDKVEE